MNTVNHVYIGRIIYKYFKNKYGYEMERSSFLLGNIAPDFYPNVVIKPHYYNTYFDAIVREIAKLYKNYDKPGDRKVFFLRLGRVCHYISDFFCYAHNDFFEGTPQEHFSYELKLSEYCKLNFKLLCKVDYNDFRYINDTEEISFDNKIRKIHDYFKKCETKNYANDTFFAVYACVAVVKHVAKLT